MKCTRGAWIFLALVLLCFLAIPLHVGVLRVRIPPRLTEELFKNFTAKYNRTYVTPEEFQKRLGIFKVSFRQEKIPQSKINHFYAFFIVFRKHLNTLFE